MVFKKGSGKKDAKPETVVTPTVEVVSTSPKIKAFCIDKDAGVWKLIIVELQDDKVVSKKQIDCENKAHALEKFKIRFAETFFLGK